MLKIYNNKNDTSIFHGDSIILSDSKAYVIHLSVFPLLYLIVNIVKAASAQQTSWHLFQVRDIKFTPCNNEACKFQPKYSYTSCMYVSHPKQAVDNFLLHVNVFYVIHAATELDFPR